ncbi:MAG TPA: aldose 1-epimerase [Azospirillaceae bacterium]|nr:aldose 1-epimerase [Azospirillaceae bacterium]
MAPSEGIELRRGRLICVVAPEHGGSIRRFALERDGDWLDLMRPAPVNTRSPLAMACFPLIPFSNRIAHGRFAFAGRSVTLPPNMDGCPHPIHGQGWLESWAVDGREANWLRLSYQHRADDWPWCYRAVQTFELERERLAVTLELLNESAEPFPAGIGLHPYFPKPPGTRLTAEVGAMWLTDGEVLPTSHAAPPPPWDPRQGLDLDRVVLDHGFTGWNGRADIDWPVSGIRLSMVAEGPMNHLVVYAPKNGDFFCAEPVSHMTDAVNHSEAAPEARGLAVLESGGRLAGRVTFTVG